ncbi:hypothetical protein Tco_0795329 [Tanacetum coccineum]
MFSNMIQSYFNQTWHDKMADENVPAPTRIDEYGILQNTNFFSAFTASADDSDLLRSALGITPKDSAHPFVAPPAGDLVIDFVNNLGYPEELQFVSKMYVNNLYQPWRTILSMINQILTGKTSDDYSLGNLKFVPKGGLDEVFGMPIPKDLITDGIRNSEYYEKYMEMAARKPTTVTYEEGRKKMKKAPPAVMKVRKGKRFDHLVDEEDEEPQPALEIPVEDDEYNLQRGIRMSLESFQAPVDGVAIREPTSVTQDASTGPSTQPKDDTSANVVRDTPSYVDAETGADMEKSNSVCDTKVINVDEQRGKDVSNTVELEERTVKLDEGQAGSDLGKTPKSRPPPERILMKEDQAGSNPRQSHVVQAGPNPKPLHEDFVAIVYPQVHESLKLTSEEQVHI